MVFSRSSTTNGLLLFIWMRKGRPVRRDPRLDYEPSRTRNTKKCESEKLTMKLTRIATALAIKIGSKRTCAAKTSAVVLTINPTMPDTTKVAYARQLSFRPDSAANVIEEFRMYDPVAATSHEIILAAIMCQDCCKRTDRLTP